MILRKLISTDTEAVLALAILAWQDIYRGYRETMGEALFAHCHANWEQRKRKEVREACEGNDHYHAWVAEIDGQVAGFITFRIDTATREGVIGNNAVAPQFQGRGIASALMEKAMDTIRAAGIRHVVVVTGGDAAHAPARRLYEKSGFGAAMPAVTYHLLFEP